MAAVSPQGALLALCISRLPERSVPRHPWAAEVLVEQLWACVSHTQGSSWHDILTPLIRDGGVDKRRVRAEMWELARLGALIPVGVGNEARFAMADDTVDQGVEPEHIAEQERRTVDYAVDQLTARLLAFSKTSRACG